MAMICQFCSGVTFSVLAAYTAPPAGETKFPIDGHYFRQLLLCENCGHIVNWCPEVMVESLDKLYSGGYVDAVYKDMDGIKAAYDRVQALPWDKSDNWQRVGTLEEYYGVDWPALSCHDKRLSLFDVGCGIGVFAAAMKGDGWDVAVLDQDERFVYHALGRGCSYGMVDDWMNIHLKIQEAPFDLISFVHVMEHRREPGPFLAKAKQFLKPDGLVFVEVPWSAAMKEGWDREEFWLDHWNIFSPASFCLLAHKAGLTVARLDTAHDPSGKWVLRGFLTV